MRARLHSEAPAAARSLFIDPPDLAHISSHRIIIRLYHRSSAPSALCPAYSLPDTHYFPLHCRCDQKQRNENNNAKYDTSLLSLLAMRCCVVLSSNPLCRFARFHSLLSTLSLSLSTRRSSPHLFPLALVFFTTLHAQPPSLFSHSSFQRCTCPPSHAPVFYSSFLSVARSASRTLLCCFVLFLALFPMKCESQAAVRCLKMLRRARPWASSASAVRITAPFAAKRAVIRRAIS